MKDGYFIDNMVIYIEKKIQKFSYDSIIDDFKNMKKMMNNPLYMCNFFYTSSYTKLCIYFYWISDNN